MQFDANLAPARANPVSGQAGSIESEIDLYDELLAFAEMSPEEQQLYLADANSVSEAPQPPRPAPVEPETVDGVDLENAESTAGSLVVIADSTPLDMKLDVKLDEELEANQAVAEFSDAGDPLVGLNLDGAFTVLSGNGCLACGAASAADDLFCMSCGSFLNGVASNSPSNPVCDDCSEGITIGEIFCPWCGSVLAGS